MRKGENKRMESRLIEYDDDGTVLEGYFVSPDAARDRWCS